MFKKSFAALDKRLKEIEREVLPKNDENEYIGGLLYGLRTFLASRSLREDVESIRKDFEELDGKYDLLEEYLGIEFVEEKTSSNDWSKKSSFYRKVKPSPKRE